MPGEKPILDTGPFFQRGRAKTRGLVGGRAGLGRSPRGVSTLDYRDRSSARTLSTASGSSSSISGAPVMGRSCTRGIFPPRSRRLLGRSPRTGSPRTPPSGLRLSSPNRVPVGNRRSPMAGSVWWANGFGVPLSLSLFLSFLSRSLYFSLSLSFALCLSLF